MRCSRCLYVAGASAHSTADIEVRVWQAVSDEEAPFVAARPEGGTWGTVGLFPLEMSGLSSTGSWHNGDATLAVALASGPLNVDVRVWQGVSDAQRLYVSAHPEGVSWKRLGTVPLDMSGLTSSGSWRYGAVTVESHLKIGLLYAAGDDPVDPSTVPRTFDLAIKHINEAGGVFGQPVEAVYGVTTAFPESAVQEAWRLVEGEGVHAIVGPGSSAQSIAVVENVIAKAGIPAIAGSATSPLLTALDDNDFFFRTALSDVFQGPALARIARERGFENVGVIYRDDAWGRGIVRAFEEAWDGQVRAVAAGVDRTTFLDELRASGAKARRRSWCSRSWPKPRRSWQEALDNAISDQFVFAEGKSLSLVEGIGAEPLAGMYGAAASPPPGGEALAVWNEAYAAEYGDVPVEAYVREFYDAAIAIALAAEAASSLDGAAIRDQLRAIGGAPGETVIAGAEGFAAALQILAGGGQVDYDGADNDLDWDENGDIRRGYVGIWRFTEGRPDRGCRDGGVRVLAATTR